MLTPPPRSRTPLTVSRKPTRKPLGAPLAWTDADLDAFSTVTPADLKTAQALWQNEAPSQLKQLLQAQVEEGQ